jgi:uncharacterized membrane protein YkoI
MNNLTKTTLGILLVGTLGFGGFCAVALATPNNSNHFIIQGIKDDKEMDETSEDSGTPEIEATQENAQLQSLAKITATQAKEAALTVQNGQVHKLELKEEDGNLVYQVTIGTREVFVDAGNGKVLYTQGVNENLDEATEQARFHSSIQVPDGDHNE